MRKLKILFTAQQIEREFCKKYQEALRRAGFEVTTFGAGRLLAELQRKHFDLIILIGSGTDFISEIATVRKAGVRTRLIYVYVVHDTDRDFEGMLKADYLETSPAGLAEQARSLTGF